MKKLIISLLVVCMLSLVAVSAFAYSSTTEAWIESASYNASTKTLSVTLVEGLTGTNCAGGWRFAVFSAAPDMTVEGDAGFWNVYKGAEGTDNQGNGTLLAGKPDASGQTSTVTVELVEGETYYIGAVGLTNDWNWTTAVYEFTYGEGGNDTADISVIAYAVTAIAGLGALVVAKKR
ncbi:MAG: hypothetical protein IKK58_01470 [Clostridia bacterium]|nr:hypothetical protein [Clostridia bacterium]